MSHASAGVTVHVVSKRRQYFDIFLKASGTDIPFAAVVYAIRRASSVPLPIVAKCRDDVVVFCAAFRADVPVSTVICTCSRVFPVEIPVVDMFSR